MANNNSTKTIDELKADLAALQAEIKQKETEEIERQKKEAAAKQAELEKVKETRKKEVEVKIEELGKLIADYIKDYGSYSSEYNASDNSIFPYLWHMFL